MAVAPPAAAEDDCVRLTSGRSRACCCCCSTTDWPRFFLGVGIANLYDEVGETLPAPTADSTAGELPAEVAYDDEVAGVRGDTDEDVVEDDGDRFRPPSVWFWLQLNPPRACCCCDDRLAWMLACLGNCLPIALGMCTRLWLPLNRTECEFEFEFEFEVTELVEGLLSALGIVPVPFAFRRLALLTVVATDSLLDAPPKWERPDAADWEEARLEKDCWDDFFWMMIWERWWRSGEGASSSSLSKAQSSISTSQQVPKR